MYYNPFKQEYFDVENLALRYYYLHEGLSGMHCENSFGKTLFGLLMWEIIFDSTVPYVFQTPFQAVPLDFGSKDFYILRKDKIHDRIGQISAMSKEELDNEITTKHNLHKNKYNSFVNWDSVRLTPKRLSEITSIIGGKGVSKILENYAVDYKYWNHGMPDLILWNSSMEAAKFSEVKSENDRLSEVQVAWLNFFNENGIEAEVCYINRQFEDETVTDCKIIDIFTKETN